MRQKLVGALLCLWVGVAQANEDGLVGFVIGMPLGAVAGGWLGVSIGGLIGGVAGGTIGAFAGGSIGGGLGGLLGDKIRDARGGRIGPKWLMGTMLSGGVGGLSGAIIMGGPTGVLVGGSAGVLIGGTILHRFISGRPTGLKTYGDKKSTRKPRVGDPYLLNVGLSPHRDGYMVAMRIEF